jgi:acyl-coenzyme A thioesterase PaaI-like protein
VSDSERTRCAEELADELRRAIAKLANNDVPLEQLARARELAGSLGDQLDGPSRPRWYDGDAPAGNPTPAARRAYTDQSPVRGRLNPIAPPMVTSDPVSRADGGVAVEARVTLGPAYEGPPHGAHGGWVAALFDDLLGQSQQLARRAGVTATLQVRYRNITPLDEELRLTAWIHEEKGRRVVARATCHAGETLTADAEAVFVAVDFDEIRGRMLARKQGDSGA